MPDEAVVEGAPAPAETETPDAPISIPEVASPTPRANVPPKNASEAFDAIANEAKEEIAEREKEDASIDAAVKKAAAAKDEDAEDDEDEPTPAKADDDEDDEDEDETETKDDADEDADKTAEGEETPEQSVAEQILELMKNPETLEAALRQAGVDTIQELPFVKDLLGRERQSAADQTANEIARAEWEAKNIEGVMTEGRKAQKSVVDLMEKLTEDINNEVEELDIPSAELINEAFESFGKGAMQAYHNAHFGAITDKVYQYPEYQNLSQEQRDTLAQKDGAPPADWVEAHLEIGRANLWQMAQEDVASQARQYVEDQNKILTEAHKLEIEKLQTKFDKKLERAIAKATEETRAAALADFATKGTAPKVPQKDSAPSVDDEEVDYSSFESIAESVKRSLARSGSGV